MTVVESLLKLYVHPSPSDKDIIYVQGFWNGDDGGGGFFIFDASSNLNPVYKAANTTNPQVFNDILGVGYSANYDGMVCKSSSHINSDGRWIRQWDRGKLNLRWFGARPSGTDTSLAFNAALKYAQFEPQPSFIPNPNAGPDKPNEPNQIPNPNITLFDHQLNTRPGKTIFIPSGRYYFNTFISTITYGVVIEGEGNMGTSAHGTRLLIAHEYTSTASTLLGVGNDTGAFFRFYANGSNNSGGGLKDLSIDIPDLSSVGISGYDANIVSLISTNTSCVDEDGNTTYCPSVSKWKGENLVFTLHAKAKRAIFMKSNQNDENGEYSGRRRIRDAQLINCWFAGASVNGETVRATQSSGLHIIGGFFASGLGAVNDDDPSLPPPTVLPGIFLSDCANMHLNGVDLTHAEIKIHRSSRHISIDCRFGRLLIYNGLDKNHVDLQVSKKYVLNPRTPIPPNLDCANAPVGYKCYNNAHEIECDDDPDWMHNTPCPNV